MITSNQLYEANIEMDNGTDGSKNDLINKDVLALLNVYSSKKEGGATGNRNRRPSKSVS